MLMDRDNAARESITGSGYDSDRPGQDRRLGWTGTRQKHHPCAWAGVVKVGEEQQPGGAEEKARHKEKHRPAGGEGSGGREGRGRVNYDEKFMFAHSVLLRTYQVRISKNLLTFFSGDEMERKAGGKAARVR